MARVTRLFPFDTTTDGWTFSANGGSDLVADRIPDEGGVLQVRRSGRNARDGAPYYEWLGTWQNLGVLPGKWVTGVTVDLRWRCSEANVPGTGSNASLMGPVELRSGDGATVRHTFWEQSAGGVEAVTAWDDALGARLDRWIQVSPGNIIGLNEPSDTQIRLRVWVNPKTANNANAAVTLRVDDIVATVMNESEPSELRILTGWRVYYADFLDRLLAIDAISPQLYEAIHTTPVPEDFNFEDEPWATILADFEAATPLAVTNALTAQSTTHTTQQMLNYAAGTSRAVFAVLYFDDFAPGRPYREVIYGQDWIGVDSNGSWYSAPSAKRFKPGAIVLEGAEMNSGAFNGALRHHAFQVARTL